MRVHLAYGHTGLGVDLPDAVHVVQTDFVPGIVHEEAALVHGLRHPIAGPPLADRVHAGDTVVVVHSDITRATPNDRILPILLAELERAGIARRDITLLNALGTHRCQTEDELRGMLGARLVETYRCLQHDAHDDASLLPLGTTSFGHRVRVNRQYMEANVRILTGFIEPHFFAGFSGGPKSVLPALAGAESVLTNHGYEMIAHPQATWGITQGNPIWEEICEVALSTDPTFLLNVTLNTQGQITGVFCGDLLAAHGAGCEFVRNRAMVGMEAPFDIVVTTNSGYPLDQNLYQAVKGMSAARQVVAKGGAIVIAAACQDGLPDHGRYAALLAEARSPQGVIDMITRPGFSQPDQWQVQIQALIQLWADVHVYSDGLTDRQITDALLTPSRNISATVARLQAAYGPDARIGVMPDGPQTIAYLTNGGA